MKTDTPRRRPIASCLLVALTLLVGAGCRQEAPARPSAAVGAAVAAGTPDAARVGREILERGGNAADAAVAVSLALAVTEPGQSGLGGWAVALVRPAGATPVVLAVPPVPLAGEDGATDGAGASAAAAPALLPVLASLLDRHGSGRLTWEELVQPAATLAEEGFPLGRHAHRTLVREYARILADDGMRSTFLTESDAIGAEGGIRTRPALAATLRRIARDGPGDLYTGELAAELLEWAEEEVPALNEPALRAATLVEESPALEGRFGAWTVWVPPEPFAGPAVLRALELLEIAPETVWDRQDVRTPWLVEALAWAFGDDGGDLASHLASLPALPVFAPDSGAAPGRSGRSGAAEDPPGPAGETTHFSILDEEGNAVAVTQSLGAPYGAAILAGDLGFVLGTVQGEEPESVPGGGPGRQRAGRTADAAGTEGPDVPGRDPDGGPHVRWASPTLVTRGDSLELVLGSPGGPRGVSAVVQVTLAWTRAPRDLLPAVTAPRVHVGPGPGARRTRAYFEGLLTDAADSLLVDPRNPWSVATREGVAARGFLPTERDTGLYFEGVSPWFGGVNAVARVAGEWIAAADPRRDGSAERVETIGPAPLGVREGAGGGAPRRRVP